MIKARKLSTRKPASLAAVTLVTALPMVALGTGPAVAEGVVVTQVYTVASVATTSPVVVPQSAVAGASSNYSVSFTTATPLTAGVDTITLSDPSGSTIFPSSTADYLVVDSTGPATPQAVPSAVLASGGSSVTLGLPGSAAAGDSLTVYIVGVTNPTNGGNYSLDLSTSEVPVPVTKLGYPIGVAGASSPASVGAGEATIELSSPSPSTAAVYSIGGLEANAALAGGSATLELIAPSGTVFPASAADYDVIDLSNASAAVEPSAVGGGGTDDAVLTLGANVSSGDLIDVFASGVVNPPAGNYTISVLGNIEATTSASAAALPTASGGYWLVTKNGAVYGVGGATALGKVTTSASTGPVVGIASTPDGKGYWVLTRDGTVSAFGDAQSYGDLPADDVTASDIVAIAPTADGRGYWLVGRDGGLFAFGDAKFYGSVPALGLHVSDVVGMAASPGGGGYSIVGSDGGVFTFGSAKFDGSLPGLGAHVADIRAIIPSASGGGYVLVGTDGGAFVFGAGAQFQGSLPGKGVSVDDIVGIALTGDDNGYYMAGANGSVYTFGDALSLPAPAGIASNLPIAAIAGT
jgi:hypothetical protein